MYEGDILQDLAAEESNVAKNLIEDLMVAANGVAARFMSAKKYSALRRIVRTPLHWDRIVELAAMRGVSLPKDADGAALEEFLLAARAKDPATFPDLSLSVIKLMGAGEYVVERPGGDSPGHFGLAVKDYAHTTAPNRRFPDLILQRLLKAALASRPQPYSNDELDALAQHCTEQEDAAKKVERQVVKSRWRRSPSRRAIGETFDAMVTGASDKGVWVRLAHPPDRGKIGHPARRPKSRRPFAREARPHRPRARLHRLRPRLRARNWGRSALARAPPERASALPTKRSIVADDVKRPDLVRTTGVSGPRLQFF